MVAITDSAYSYQLGDVNPISRFARNVAIQMGEVHYVKVKPISLIKHSSGKFSVYNGQFLCLV